MFDRGQSSGWLVLIHEDNAELVVVFHFDHDQLTALEDFHTKGTLHGINQPGGLAGIGYGSYLLGIIIPCFFQCVRKHGQAAVFTGIKFRQARVAQQDGIRSQAGQEVLFFGIGFPQRWNSIKGKSCSSQTDQADLLLQRLRSQFLNPGHCRQR